MISQWSKIFSVEYTASGAAIMTADLLGLDARNSVVDSDRHSRVSTTNNDLHDLIGLDFGAQPRTRLSVLAQPKCPERPYAKRDGIIEDVHLWRGAALLQENSEANSAQVNGTVAASAEDETPVVTERPDAVVTERPERPVPVRRVAVNAKSENPVVAERPVVEDKNAVERPVPTRRIAVNVEDENPVIPQRPVAENKNAPVVEQPVPARRVAIRSSSFDGRLSASNDTSGQPIPPPKRNRQRAASNMATLQSQVEQLTALLKSAAEERDAAIAKVTELEAELNKYREKYGHIN